MSENKIKDIEKMDLESAMKRLEVVVEAMSRQNVSLEDSLALYEEGVALVALCRKKLEVAEQKISCLYPDENGELKEKPFSVEE